MKFSEFEAAEIAAGLLIVACGAVLLIAHLAHAVGLQLASKL